MSSILKWSSKISSFFTSQSCFFPEVIRHFFLAEARKTRAASVLEIGREASVEGWFCAYGFFVLFVLLINLPRKIKHNEQLYC